MFVSSFHLLKSLTYVQPDLRESGESSRKVAPQTGSLEKGRIVGM